MRRKYTVSEFERTNVTVTRRTLVSTGLSLASFLLLSGGACAEGWLTSWDEAAKVSQQTGKPILMDFTGSDWCIWCQRLKKEVFDTAEFQTWADRNVVLLELDFPQETEQPAAVKEQNAKLAERYAVQGYPTVLFVNAAGDKLAEYGYDKGGPSVWTLKAQTLLDKK